MTETAPWWGIPVLAGGFALAGVLIAQSVALWIDRRKTRREDQRRWDRERQTTYVTYIASITNALEVGKVTPEFMANHGSVQLLGGHDLSEAADGVIAALGAPKPSDPLAVWEATERFIELARHELGIVPPSNKFQITANSVFELFVESLSLAGQALISPFPILNRAMSDVVAGYVDLIRKR